MQSAKKLKKKKLTERDELRFVLVSVPVECSRELQCLLLYIEKSFEPL